MMAQCFGEKTSSHNVYDVSIFLRLIVQNMTQSINISQIDRINCKICLFQFFERAQLATGVLIDIHITLTICQQWYAIVYTMSIEVKEIKIQEKVKTQNELAHMMSHIPSSYWNYTGLTTTSELDELNDPDVP